MKDKNGIAITNAFQKILNESNLKPNKIWVDKGSKFIIDQWNHGCRIKIQKSTHNEGKSVFVERFIRTLKNKIYKYIISISKKW